jgi:hypothetical protein
VWVYQHHTHQETSIDTSNDTREVDGFEDTGVGVEITRFGYVYDVEMPNMIKVTANPQCWPNESATITPAAARVLAAHLTELADEADLRNLEANT